MSHYLGTVSTTGYLIAVDVDGGPMDCEDDDRIHVWLVVPAWATRRAMHVQGTPFLRAWLLSGGLSPERFDETLTWSTKALEGWSNGLTKTYFQFRIELPDYEAEGGERVEITDIKVSALSPEFAERMGAPGEFTTRKDGS